MSYILDALKRADAERERGAVPGLHARQVTTPAVPSAANAHMRLWLASATALVLVAVAVGWWIWQTPARDTRPAPVPAALIQPMPMVQPPSAQPLATPTAAASGPTFASAPPPAQQAVVAVLPTVASVSSNLKQNTVPEARPKSFDKAAKLSISAVAPLPIAKEPTTKATPVAVPLLSELSEEIRRQIPPLTITGAVYSDNPTQRLLLVNNQVLTQGSLAAPELSLEEIRPKSSIFNFRGTRFRLAH